MILDGNLEDPSIRVFSLSLIFMRQPIIILSSRTKKKILILV